MTFELAPKGWISSDEVARWGKDTLGQNGISEGNSRTWYVQGSPVQLERGPET